MQMFSHSDKHGSKRRIFLALVSEVVDIRAMGGLSFELVDIFGTGF